jgi:hypothetical protein
MLKKCFIAYTNPMRSVNKNVEQSKQQNAIFIV